MSQSVLSNFEEAGFSNTVSSQKSEDMSEQLENIKQENAKLKEQIEELISNEQEALDNLDHCNKDNKSM